MKKYLSFLRIRFSTGLQYRAAAWAGAVTHFFWGGMNLLMFREFYRSGENALPMTFSELSSYIWLQQAFLALFMAWYFDNDIFSSIIKGDVAYDLCRPVDLYKMWFVKNMATRLSRVVLRCFPILIVAAFLPEPYCISMPATPLAGLMFLISMALGFLILVSFSMLIYISAFYTLSPLGIRILATSVVEFFAGAIIPLPFFPKYMQVFMLILPFASMQNTPFQIYNGYISGSEIINSILLQIVWLALLLTTGKLFMKKALKKIVLQGG